MPKVTISPNLKTTTAPDYSPGYEITITPETARVSSRVKTTKAPYNESRIDFNVESQTESDAVNKQYALAWGKLFAGNYSYSRANAGKLKEAVNYYLAVTNKAFHAYNYEFDISSSVAATAADAAYPSAWVTFFGQDTYATLAYSPERALALKAAINFYLHLGLSTAGNGAQDANGDIQDVPQSDFKSYESTLREQPQGAPTTKPYGVTLIQSSAQADAERVPQSSFTPVKTKTLDQVFVNDLRPTQGLAASELSTPEYKRVRMSSPSGFGNGGAYAATGRLTR
jgi:hypothetical protein